MQCLEAINLNVSIYVTLNMKDEVYNIQNSYFRHLVNEGVIVPDSVIAGNVYGSLEATI